MRDTRKKKKPKPPFTGCVYQVPWAGLCGLSRAEGSKFCQEHSEAKCQLCGSQATKGCSHTSICVCGHYLCKDHNSCSYHSQK